MKYLHKICEIYATPPNDSKRIIEILKNTGFFIAEMWDDKGKFKFEVFENDPLGQTNIEGN